MNADSDKKPENSYYNIHFIIPNFLSFSRILITPLIFLAIKNNDILIIIVLALWSVLSDFWDGKLARKWNVTSDIGKILDPLGDKLCIAAAAVSLSIYGDLPFLITLIIVGRDFFILLFGIALARKIKHVPASNMIGKITVTVLTIVLLIYIFKIDVLYNFAFGVALIFIVISSASYLYLAYKFISARS